MRRLLLLLSILSTIAAPETACAKPPNILFILADDLAWSDLGCYGHPWHETPHLDSLAAEGMRFSDAYAPAPICSASRASILTGKTPARLNFEFVTKHEPGRQQIDRRTPLSAPPFTLNLPLAEQTIAEQLARLDYRTAFFGKWHLNAHFGRYLGWSPTHGPQRQGFEIATEDFGSHPYAWNKEAPPSITTNGKFPHDSMIDRAVNFLKQPHSQPYFLMLSSFYVHTPIRTPCAWLIDKYERKIPREAANREQRLRYAAFVETLDHYVGRMLTAIDGHGEETLVLFTSDNGGHPEFTANAPLRGSKWNLYEGGIRVPMLVRWPGHIRAGTVCQAPVIGYDLLPTFTDIAGGAAPEVDGISFLPCFENPQWNPERELIWHFPYYHPERGFAVAPEGIGINDFVVSRTRPQSAIRRGNEKLILFAEDRSVRLYDLAADLSEQHDLSKRHPERAAELLRRLETQLGEMSARFAE